MTVITSVANIISVVVCNGTYSNCCVMIIIIDVFEVDVLLRCRSPMLAARPSTGFCETMVSDPCSRHDRRVFQEIACTSAIPRIKMEASMHEGRGLERLALGITVANITSISPRGLKGDGGARTVPVEVLVASRAPCKCQGNLRWGTPRKR